MGGEKRHCFTHMTTISAPFCSRPSLLPSDKRLHSYGKSPFFLGKLLLNGNVLSAMSAITRTTDFYGHVQYLFWHHQRVNPIQNPIRPPFSYGFPMVFPLFPWFSQLFSFSCFPELDFCHPALQRSSRPWAYPSPPAHWGHRNWATRRGWGRAPSPLVIFKSLEGFQWLSLLVMTNIVKNSDEEWIVMKSDL